MFVIVALTLGIAVAELVQVGQSFIPVHLELPVAISGPARARENRLDRFILESNAWGTVKYIHVLYWGIGAISL